MDQRVSCKYINEMIFEEVGCPGGTHVVSVCVDISAQAVFLIHFTFSYRGKFLRNIDQLGLEFHKVYKNVKAFARIVKGLYANGFKIIHWEPNKAAMPDPKHGYRLFEIVIW